MASTRRFEVTLFPDITLTSPELGVILVTASVPGVAPQLRYHYAAFLAPLGLLLLPVTTSAGHKKLMFMGGSMRRRRHQLSFAFSTCVPRGFILESVPWLLDPGNL